jgi:hypothetical protein
MSWFTVTALCVNIFKIDRVNVPDDYEVVQP